MCGLCRFLVHSLPDTFKLILGCCVPPVVMGTWEGKWQHTPPCVTAITCVGVREYTISKGEIVLLFLQFFTKSFW